MRVENRFGELLAKKERVERRRISRRTVSDETGISLTSVQNWATNSTSRFDDQQIIAFCKYFNCEISDLLVLVPEETLNTPEMESSLVAVA